MTVRLTTPYRNLGVVDLKRDSRVKFDKVLSPFQAAPLTLRCPDTLLIATCSTLNAQTVNVQFIATGGTLPYVFTLVAGVLPATLTLNPATGRIEGNTTTFPPTGNFPITVKVTDADGNSVMVNCTLVVAFCDTNAGNLAAKHPITVNYANPGFFNAAFLDVAPFVIGPVNCTAPTPTNCTAGLYASGLELASVRACPVGSFPPCVIPARFCDDGALSPVMKMYQLAPETINHQASVTVGTLNEPPPAGQIQGPNVAAACRIRKVGGPANTSSYQWVAFSFGWFSSVSPQLVIIDNFGSSVETHGVGAAVNPGDVLTLVCVCTRAFGFVNGVLKLQKSILCDRGRPGIFEYNYLPNVCLHQSISDWSAALRA